MKILGRRYLPLHAYFVYSFIVWLSLIISPIKYNDMHYYMLFSYLFIFMGVFVTFFILGSRGAIEKKSIKKKENKNHLIIVNIFLVLAIILSVNEWRDFIVSGKYMSAGDLGEAYVDSYSNYVRGQATINFSYVANILGTSIVLICLLFIIPQYETIKGWTKYCSLFVVFTYLIINVIGSGKLKYFGDIVIYLFYAKLIYFGVAGGKYKLKTFILLFSLSILFFFIFTYVLSLRYVAIGVNADNIQLHLSPLLKWDEDTLLIKFLGKELAFSLAMFLGYFTSGLYGLNICLQLPFEWTYLVGNSYSLAKVVEIIFNSPGFIIEHTYPVRAGSEGWGLNKWHSVFSWFASDVTFFGVIVLGGFFAFFYGRVWIKCLNNSNPFANSLFLYLSLGLIFSYSNNQMFHSLSGVIGFFSLLFFYLCWKKI